MNATSNSPREWIVWTLAALAAAAALAWAFPRAFPLFPDDWRVNRQEATAIALERFRDLGEPVEEPYVVTTLDTDPVLERRLQLELGAAADPGELAGSELAERILSWQVRVYPPTARSREWIYQVRISPAGEMLALERRLQPAETASGISAPIAPESARRRAEELLTRQGVDLARFEPPEVRRRELPDRVETVLRYRAREAALGAEAAYGLEATFAGDTLTGFASWIDDPAVASARDSLQHALLVMQARTLLPFLLFPFVAVFFLRLYHEGQVGVRRALQVFVLIFAAGAVLLALTAKGAVEESFFGIFSRRQSTWIWGLQLLLLWFAPLALVASLSWSVGEARCRERWGMKLAAVDALFTGRLASATVARSSFRGFAGGVILGAGLLLLAVGLGRVGFYPLESFLFEPWYGSAALPGLGILAYALAYVTFSELFARLFLLPAAVRRFGLVGGGALVALVSAALFFSPLEAVPVGPSMLGALLAAAALVALFLIYDLLTSLTAAFTLTVTLISLPFLFTDDAFLQLQGSLPLLVAALPMLLSVRHLLSGEEHVYRYEDVPPHVRRIAERERQRVELETARKIQSSILPELPPQLAGVEIAHAYLPATEVGGDFYDVLALEDGRLALAVGDVAGHGVSSGLVMSMAKSALAVQVGFNPEIGAVFRTLNRMVYQTARRRLLATLCYAILDPARRELLYASAGHLFPYRISEGGRIEPLESSSYPLGVRDELAVVPQLARLDSGDTLFLMSDGVIEAHAPDSDEVFGFGRLEETLRRHAGNGPASLRDAVLEELATFAGGAPQEDDQTILVLRLP